MSVDGTPVPVYHHLAARAPNSRASLGLPAQCSPHQGPCHLYMSSSPSSSSQSLYNVEVECHTLGALVQYGAEIWGDFYLVTSDDFSKVNRPIYELIKQQLDQTPPASVSPMTIAERAKGFGVSLEGGMEVVEYLDALRIRFVSKTDAPSLARELKRLAVRRQLVEKAHQAQRQLIENPNATFEQMAGIVEKTITSVTTEYYKPEVEQVMGDGMIAALEKQAETPLNADDAGFLGPFKSINETIGPLTYRGSYTVVGSRSGGGKSSLGWFYQTFLAEKYNLPILHLDSAEMTIEELQWRAVCCLSEGKIPYWAVYRRQWTANKEWARLIRTELWPRVAKLKVYFKNTGNMSSAERIAFIRRFYYNRVGRGNMLLIHNDYLKGVESMNQKTQEYQAIGNYVNDFKSLITNEIEAAGWDSVQLNRSGIVTGKKEGDVDDSEGAFSLSDRIIQQSTHSFGLRYKVPEELAREHQQFGGLRLTPLKKRQLLGDRYEEMLKPVKLDNGRFTQNYINLDTKGFWYKDYGSLVDMQRALGKAPISMSQGQGRGAGGGL